MVRRNLYFVRVFSGRDSERMTSGKADRKGRGADSLLTPDAAEIHKRSVVVAGHRTSISVENGFWQVLLEVSGERGVSANRLITEIDRIRTGNLSSAIRLFVLAEVMKSEP